MTPIEGIIEIRKIVGLWLRPDGAKARDVVVGITNVLLSVSVPVLIAPLTPQQQVAKDLIDSLEAADRLVDKALAAPPPTHFAGLKTPQKVDMLSHLEDMIEQACHKPGEWREGPCAGGDIDGQTFTQAYDLQIGHLRQRRDAFLAIDAVNALPELIKRVRDAERRVAELQGKLDDSVKAHNQLIDHVDRMQASANA